MIPARAAGLLFAAALSCNPCSDAEGPRVPVNIRSGRYLLGPTLGPPPDGGEASVAADVVLTVDRAAGTASFVGPAGSRATGGLSAVDRDLWPLACAVPPNATHTPSTLHVLEPLRLNLPRLDLGAAGVFSRPLLLATCPGRAVVLTEYRLDLLRGIFDPVLGTTSAGKDASVVLGDAGVGLWICAVSRCLVFQPAAGPQDQGP